MSHLSQSPINIKRAAELIGKTKTATTNQDAVQPESRNLTPGNRDFINKLLGRCKTALSSVVGPRLPNEHFSLLGAPSSKNIAAATALLLKETAKKLEEEKQKNLEEVKAAKDVVNKLDIDPDLKREMIAALSQTDTMGRPLSQAGVVIMRYAKQGKDKVVKEFEDVKTRVDEHIV